MKSPHGNTRGTGSASPGRLPLYCDYHCPHASFAPADATGACRREQGVYCTILGAFTAKNSRCRARTAGSARPREKG